MTGYPTGTGLRSATRFHADAVGTDDALVWTGNRNKLRSTIPLIYCHGLSHTAAEAQWRANAQGGDDFRPIAGWGHPIILTDLGGTATWGNDTALAALNGAIAWAHSTYGTRDDLVAVGGESMGALLAMEWAWLHPTSCAAVWLRVPCIDLQYAHDTNALFASTIDSAYTNHAGYLAQLANRSPILNIARLRAVRDRMRIWAATDDEFFPLADTRRFAHDVGCRFDTIVGNHEDALDTPAGETARWIHKTITATDRFL